jgi:hypothetical protein
MVFKDGSSLTQEIGCGQLLAFLKFGFRTVFRDKDS